MKKEELWEKIEELNLNLERSKIFDYVELLNNPRRLIYKNFIAGLARGFGMAVGFTLLGAIVIYFLQKVITWNIPLIGDFIADLVKIVQNNL